MVVKEKTDLLRISQRAKEFKLEERGRGILIS